MRALPVPGEYIFISGLVQFATFCGADFAVGIRSPSLRIANALFCCRATHVPSNRFNDHESPPTPPVALVTPMTLGVNTQYVGANTLCFDHVGASSLHSLYANRNFSGVRDLPPKCIPKFVQFNPS